MFVERPTKPLVAALFFVAACGGTTESDTTAESTSTTQGSEVPPISSEVPTAGPTEESPGVFTGIVSCNIPNTIPFDAAASEVVSFEATLTAVDQSGNPTVTLLEGTEPVIESGNAVAVDGSAYPNAPLEGSRTYNIRRTASYALRVSVEQCGSYRYRVAFRRDVPAAPNLSRESASAITVGTASRGTLGCDEHRFFALDVARRSTFHVTLGGAGRLPGGTGQLSVTLLSSDGTPVVASGNPISAQGTVSNPAGAPSTSDITISRAGRYFLDLNYGSSCTIADYELTLAR